MKANKEMFKISIFKLIFASVFLSSLQCKAVQPDGGCKRWFAASKVKAGSKFCEEDCGIISVDMGTFMCPGQCNSLCQAKENRPKFGKLLYYPGLTALEKKLVESMPQNAMNAYVQKIRAEDSSDRNFPEQGLNDEADAFRHFIWSGLLVKELGIETAREFLNAHEANPLQLGAERIMDQYNNEKGILSAQNLISSNKWSLENLEKSALDALRSKDLKVLKPGLKIPEVPK